MYIEYFLRFPRNIPFQNLTNCTIITFLFPIHLAPIKPRLNYLLLKVHPVKNCPEAIEWGNHLRDRYEKYYTGKQSII